MMATHGNNYGAGGRNHDEFGPLPDKRIENMTGIDCSAKRPELPGNINGMIREFYDRTGKKPTKLIYPGPQSYTTSIGHIVSGIGFVGLDLFNVPNVSKAYLE